jgi:polyphenol oxidase
MQNPLIRSSLLESLPGLRYGFTTLALSEAEREEIENRTATARQVHKAELATLERFEKRAREADALATFSPKLPIGVFSADCTPILIAAFHDASRRIVGVSAVHAGWRGTALGIAASSLRVFALEARKRCPGVHFVAAIGPCISRAEFEVGPEVVAAFPGAEERGLATFLRWEKGTEGERRKYLFDLPGENARQLQETARQEGLRLELDPLGLCTVKEALLFPSYRRQKGNAGRILSYIEFGEAV